MTRILTPKDHDEPIALPSPMEGTNAYVWGECQILVRRKGGRWDLFIWCETRHATWEEILKAKEYFAMGGVNLAVLIPDRRVKQSHPFLLHLFQVDPVDDETPTIWTPGQGT